jgi:hypothetical protein
MENSPELHPSWATDQSLSKVRGINVTEVKKSNICVSNKLILENTELKKQNKWLEEENAVLRCIMHHSGHFSAANTEGLVRRHGTAVKKMPKHGSSGETYQVCFCFWSLMSWNCWAGEVQERHTNSNTVQ